MSILIDGSNEGPHPGSTSRPSPGNHASPAPPGRGWRRRKAPPGEPRTTIPAVKQVARDLRQHSTRSEFILWNAIRSSRLSGLKFRRQHPMDRFVLDFYCPEKRLAIEIDGSFHDGREVVDAERQAILESMGIRFVRLSANLGEANLASALEVIGRAPFSYPSPNSTGEGSRAARG